MGDAAEIGFRPLRRSDLGDLHEWLADPDVRRWWVVDNDLDELEREYGPRIDGVEPTEVFVIEIDGEPSGIVQRYRNAHDSEWDAQLVAAVPMLREFPTAGIDYLLGRADVRRRGVGTRFLRQFTAVVFDDLPDVGAVVVAVQQANVASWRALERAGYRRMWEGQLHSDDPSDAGPSYLLVRRRDELDRA